MKMSDFQKPILFSLHSFIIFPSRPSLMSPNLSAHSSGSNIYGLTLMYKMFCSALTNRTFFLDEYHICTFSSMVAVATGSY